MAEPLTFPRLLWSSGPERIEIVVADQATYDARIGEGYLDPSATPVPAPEPVPEPELEPEPAVEPESEPEPTRKRGR